MKIEESLQDGIVVLTVRGKMTDLNISGIHDKIKNLIKNDVKKVVIDLGKVKWINSRGLGVLIASHSSLVNAGGALHIARAGEKINSVLMITKLNTIFKTFPTVEDAADAF